MPLRGRLAAWLSREPGRHSVCGNARPRRTRACICRNGYRNWTRSRCRADFHLFRHGIRPDISRLPSDGRCCSCRSWNGGRRGGSEKDSGECLSEERLSDSPRYRGVSSAPPKPECLNRDKKTRRTDTVVVYLTQHDSGYDWNQRPQLRPSRRCSFDASDVPGQRWLATFESMARESWKQVAKLCWQRTAVFQEQFSPQLSTLQSGVPCACRNRSFGGQLSMQFRPSYSDRLAKLY